jgi:transcriptional regulator with XRE-family HTH domain
MDSFTGISPAEIARIIGDRYKEYRMRANMTQKEVSEKSGVSTTTIYKFESGIKSNISLTTFIALLNAIGMTDAIANVLQELPDSPYLFNKKGQKTKRIRHSK